MSELVRLTPADARRVPWKNGRGVTDELAIGPPGASFERSDFDWRISKAAVTEPGPFSSFPGFERVLVVTDGDGLILSHGDAAPPAVVRRLEPYWFDGAWSTSADLVGGEVRDFNVLTRQGRVRAYVNVVTGDARRSRLSRCDAFVHVLMGCFYVDVIDASDRSVGLLDGESLLVLGAEAGDTLKVSRVEDAGIGIALLVTIAPV